MAEGIKKGESESDALIMAKNVIKIHKETGSSNLIANGMLLTALKNIQI